MTGLLHSKINNRSYRFNLPLTIFQACLEKKIYIPRFCYHVSLKIAGNCRMCLIEEKSSIKPLASCAVTISNGMQIYTNTEVVKKAREGVLEYLLINHPLDCPICDQGGECDLQDQTMVFGADKGRFYEFKRSTPNKNLGFFIKTFLNRCIHCARCTRFLTDLAGTNEMQLLGRGYHTEISTYTKKFLSSELSGNIIDLCPVGALTSKPYAYKARVWELMSFYSHDIMDGFGSSIQIDFRGLELMRILPKDNKHLNDEWISDKTRFFYDALNVQRLTTPYFREAKSNYHQLNWLNSLNLVKNYFNYYLKFTNPKKLFSCVNFGNFLDLETSLSIKFLFKNLGSPLYSSMDCIRHTDFRAEYSVQFLSKTLSDWTTKTALTLLNTNLRFESPILNLKLKKTAEILNFRVYCLGFLSNFNFAYSHLGKSLCKKKLNFFLSTKNIVVKGWTTNFPNFFFDSSSTVSSKITDLSLAELSLNPINSQTAPFSSVPTYLSFYCGQPEFSYQEKSPLSVHLYHHMEDNHLNSNFQSKQLFLPTKFFIEKASSYCTNSIYFFNTMNPFSYTLPNTKDDWKIISAIFEYTFPQRTLFKKHSKANKILFLNFLPALNYTTPTLKIGKQLQAFFIKRLNFFSIINNFYDTTVVTRLSRVLSLASKKLVVLNDYKYISFC